MSHTSEDRVPSADEQRTEGARIIPFERPQSELQKAMQARAQEHLDREREREKESRKVAPLRSIVIVILAAIPVIAIFGAVDQFLRVVQKFMAIQASQPAQTTPEPAAEQVESSSEDGVVFLQPNLSETQQPPTKATDGAKKK
jgi:hypothetical protein